MTFLAVIPATPQHRATPPTFNVLPLRWAGLCPQCEVLYDMRTSCPYCCGDEPVNLHRVLGVMQ